MRSPARSELIQSPTTGLTKRVYKGQRWVVVTTNSRFPKPLMTAHGSKEEADRVAEDAQRQWAANGEEFTILVEEAVVV